MSAGLRSKELRASWSGESAQHRVLSGQHGCPQPEAERKGKRVVEVGRPEVGLLSPNQVSFINTPVAKRRGQLLGTEITVDVQPSHASV